MSLGGGKVEVHDGNHTRLDKTLCKNVLACTSLVCWQHIVRTENFLHCGLKTVEGLTAGIGVVCKMHGGGLAVRHGVYTGVGKHVQIDILVLKQECIVASLLDGTQTFVYGKKV